MLTDDVSVIHDVRAWLTDSVLPGNDIDDDMWRRCQDAWLRRRKSRDALLARESTRHADRKAFWTRVERDPVFCRDKRIFVWVYPAIDRTDESTKDLDREKAARDDPNLDCYWVVDDTNILAGDLIIDYEHHSGKFDSKKSRLWRVSYDRPLKKLSSGHNLYVLPEKTIDRMDAQGSSRKLTTYVKSCLNNDPDMDESLHLSAIDLKALS